MKALWKLHGNSSWLVMPLFIHVHICSSHDTLNHQLTVTDPSLPWTAMTWLPTAAVGSQLTSDVSCPLFLTFCDTGQTRSMWHTVTQCDTFKHFDHCVTKCQIDHFWSFCDTFWSWLLTQLLIALSQSTWTDVSFNVQCQDPHRIRVQPIRPSRVAFSLAWILRCIAALHLLRHLCLLCPV